jgi:arginyl-tRNA synthetase
MKEVLSEILLTHLKKLGLELPENLTVEAPKAAEHGDLSSNVAMVLAKQAKKKPRELAEALAASLRVESDLFTKVEIAGPGFLNFFLKESVWHNALRRAWADGHLVRPDIGCGKRVLVEFVSANPTGPMHVGHGRNAVVGDDLARLLEAVGYRVTREFYVNDHGVQIHTLGRSGGHYHQALANIGGVAAALPEDMYRGEYLEKLVDRLKERIAPVKDDPMAVGKLLGAELLQVIREDLKSLGVSFDAYFSESSLYQGGKIQATLDQLAGSGDTFESEGALWFRTTEYGDDKDRVLIKSDQSYTYFTPDIAYHKDKFERAYDRYLNIMGADHGGYVKRMKAAVQALGYDSEKLEFVLMQMVSLKRGGATVAMSKRSGDYVTLREVVDEVGKDAARFFFILRSHNTTLDFDLELAKKQSNENPVYYVQYAHARMCSIFAVAQEVGYPAPGQIHGEDLVTLTLPEEINLIKTGLSYPDVLGQAAQEREPHRVAFYLLELAKAFQNYYTLGKTDDRYRVVTSDKKITLAKLFLLKTLRAILADGLSILGVTAPERMERLSEE